MADSDQVLIERDGPIGKLTLNRPDRLNTISVPMLTRLSDGLLALDRVPLHLGQLDLGLPAAHRVRARCALSGGSASPGVHRRQRVVSEPNHG